MGKGREEGVVESYSSFNSQLFNYSPSLASLLIHVITAPVQGSSLEFCYIAQASLYYCILSVYSGLLWLTCLQSANGVLPSFHLLEIYGNPFQEYFSYSLHSMSWLLYCHILGFQEGRDRNACANSTIINQKYCLVLSKKKMHLTFSG